MAIVAIPVIFFLVSDRSVVVFGMRRRITDEPPAKTSPVRRT
jgi:hypothetical protein